MLWRANHLLSSPMRIGMQLSIFLHVQDLDSRQLLFARLRKIGFQLLQLPCGGHLAIDLSLSQIFSLGKDLKYVRNTSRNIHSSSDDSSLARFRQIHNSKAHNFPVSTMGFNSPIVSCDSQEVHCDPSLSGAPSMSDLLHQPPSTCLILAPSRLSSSLMQLGALSSSSAFAFCSSSSAHNHLHCRARRAIILIRPSRESAQIFFVPSSARSFYP